VWRFDKAPTSVLLRAGVAADAPGWGERADPLERGDTEDTGDPSATPEEGAGQPDGGTPADGASFPKAEHTPWSRRSNSTAASGAGTDPDSRRLRRRRQPLSKGAHTCAPSVIALVSTRRRRAGKHSAAFRPDSNAAAAHIEA